MESLPGGARAFAHLQPQDGVHRRLGRHAERLGRLFPTVGIILCFLHSVLKITERCGRDRARRKLVLDRVWAVYDSCPGHSFPRGCAVCASGPRRACQERCAPADGPQTLRQRPAVRAPIASLALIGLNALDRLMNHQDRRLYAMRYLHGTPAAARLAMRAMALQWNFHPCRARTRRDDPTRRSPFHDLNGFEYHPNWLHNLLIASSMGGRKL